MSTKFAVGETVHFRDAMARLSIDCVITRVMPEENQIRNYRIRGITETFERAVPETALAPVPGSTADAALSAAAAA